MAAVLAHGEGAVLSHRSAAGLWGMLPASVADGTGGTRIDVALPSKSGRRRRPGIRLRRCASLTADDVTRHRDIPVTTPARTIADLKPIASPAEYRRAVRQAEFAGLRTGLEPRRRKTRSELEDVFLGLCRRHHIPAPEVNVVIGKREVDFVWRNLRVAVEADGYAFHRGQVAFEDDHERDLALHALGYDVVRLTYRQLEKKPNYCMDILKEELRKAANRTQDAPNGRRSAARGPGAPGRVSA